MVVGLTGGIGSGKSTVVKLFREFDNIAVYIADDEAKRLMNTAEELKKAIIEEFGEDSYKNGLLNREYLANIVFRNKDKLALLNAIVHPQVAKDFMSFAIENKDKSYILYESAILFESGSDTHYDFIITVTASAETRIQRIIQRDNATREAVIGRMKNQWKEEKKVLQSNYVISNILLEETKKKVRKIHNILTKKNLFI